MALIYMGISIFRTHPPGHFAYVLNFKKSILGLQDCIATFDLKTDQFVTNRKMPVSINDLMLSEEGNILLSYGYGYEFLTHYDKVDLYSPFAFLCKVKRLLTTKGMGTREVIPYKNKYYVRVN